MTIEEIRELLGLFNESGVAEMEVQRGENRVRLKRASLTHEYVMAAPAGAAAPVFAASHLAPAPIAPTVPSHVAPTGIAGAGPAMALSSGAAAAAAAADAGELVKSPIVGTYYDSPSPGAPSFVKVGDQVEKGQVLCIIESMKLMNEIEAEVSGTVLSKLVENGKPVEYGQALFSIKPR